LFLLVLLHQGENALGPIIVYNTIIIPGVDATCVLSMDVPKEYGQAFCGLRHNHQMNVV